MLPSDLFSNVYDDGVTGAVPVFRDGRAGQPGMPPDRWAMEARMVRPPNPAHFPQGGSLAPTVCPSVHLSIDSSVSPFVH